MGKSWNAWNNDEYLNVIKEKHKDKINLNFDKVYIDNIHI